MSDNYKILTKKLIVFLYKKENRNKEVSIEKIVKRLKMETGAVISLIQKNSEYFNQYAEADIDSGKDFVYIGTRTVRVKLSSEGFVYAKELQLKGYSFFQNNFIYPIFMKILYVVVGWLIGLASANFSFLYRSFLNLFR